MKTKLFIVCAAFVLSACGRDGHVSSSYYGPAANSGDHVSYGSTDVRLFDMVSEKGHHCTVGVTDNNHGGVAIHCWD